MRPSPAPERGHHFELAAAVFSLASFSAIASALAADPSGFYVGAAYGRAHVEAGPISTPDGFGGTVLLDAPAFTHSAYQIMLGVRPVSFLGAEVTYMDFGQRFWPTPQAGLFIKAGQASQKGEGVFAMLYLPVPVVNVYVKAGLSRITTDLSAVYEYFGVDNCAFTPCHYTSIADNTTDTRFAAGAGLQWKLGDWGIRGEYERFDAAAANPSLISIGIAWSPP